MRTSVKLLALAGTLAGTLFSGTQTAAAGDASRFAVMGVRLAMSAPEVLAVLYAQGAQEDGVSEHVHPCALLSVSACTDTITAKLPNGTVTVRFVEAPPGFNDGREAVYTVTYAIAAAGPSEAALVLAASADDEGVAAPAVGTWCEHQAANGGGCPADGPRVSFEPGAQGAGTLTLTDLGLPARLGVAGAAEVAGAAAAPTGSLGRP